MSDRAKAVLVADDSPDERVFLVTLLDDEGYDVREAEDGEQALESARANRPDLISLDMTMPGMSGVAVYRALREDPDLRAIPVLVVTGLASDFRRFITTRRQVPPPDAYLSKPVDPAEYAKTVRRLLQGG